LWPDRIALLYYSYHVMVGLGTIFIAVMGLAAILLWRGKAVRDEVDAVAADDFDSDAVHREHCGMMTAELGGNPG